MDDDKTKFFIENCEGDLQHRVEQWVSMLRVERQLSPHTLRAYQKDLKYFLDFMTRHFGAPPNLDRISSIKLADFRAWLSRLTMDGTSNATRARSLASIRNFFKWMDKSGHVHNPYIQHLRTPKKPRKLPRALSIEKAKNLIEQSEIPADTTKPNWIGMRDRALFTVLYGCGLRIDEALSLDCGNRPKDGSVRVMGKGRKERIVPVLPIVEIALENYLELRPFPISNDSPLFLGARGKRLNQGVAQKALRDLRRAINLPESITPHSLRHSFASHLLRNGANLRFIQELLGHASLNSTQRYLHIDNEKMLETYKKSHPRAHLSQTE